MFHCWRARKRRSIQTNVFHMALTQMQIIQSLGEAMAWFDREINWGVPAAELRHLCGRLGELYAALITNGQMATEINQKGYDVVSGDGERISVKTTAMLGSNGHVSFNSRSLEFVDRIIVLRINTDEMQIETLFNEHVSVAKPLMRQGQDGKLEISLSKLVRKPVSPVGLKAVRLAQFGEFLIREMENGSIELERAGVLVNPVRPGLRELAQLLHISLLNANGNTLNTRQLGTQIIRTMKPDAFHTKPASSGDS